METASLKSREDRIRRQLSRKGYRLEKTPARSWQRAYFPPGYMILFGNIAVEGCGSRPWEATIEQIEHYAAEAPYQV